MMLPLAQPGPTASNKTSLHMDTQPDITPTNKGHMEKVGSDGMVSVVYKTTWVGERRRQP